MCAATLSLTHISHIIWNNENKREATRENEREEKPEVGRSRVSPLFALFPLPTTAHVSSAHFSLSFHTISQVNLQQY